MRLCSWPLTMAEMVAVRYAWGLLQLSLQVSINEAMIPELSARGS